MVVSMIDNESMIPSLVNISVFTVYLSHHMHKSSQVTGTVPETAEQPVMSS
jgi:hypothetical protein